MLNPDNRLLYHRMLQPPPGFRIDFAVGTTYSLDLSALLMSAFAMSGERTPEDADAPTDPVAALKALRDIGGRCAVFCQHDRILPPKQDSELFGFFGSVVVLVVPRKGGSFHPKIWLLRFIKGKEVCYRFACLSRNITFDTSWDTALVLDSMEKRCEHEDNSGLLSLIGDLLKKGNKQLSPDSLKKMQLMYDELSAVKWIVPDDFRWPARFYNMRELDFIDELPFHLTDSLLLISPFLSYSALNRILEVVPEEAYTALVSRRESLDALRRNEGGKADALLSRFSDLRFVREDIAAEEERHTLTGLHAKMLLLRTSGEVTRLYTGSANATAAGMGGRNDEFMTFLRLAWAKLKPEDFLAEANPFSSITAKYELALSPDDADDEAETVDAIFEDVRTWCIAAAPGLYVSGDPEDMAVTLTFTKEAGATPEGLSGIRVRMLGTPETLSVPVDPTRTGTAFEPGRLPAALVNPFLQFSVTLDTSEGPVSRAFVLKVPVHGLPDNIEALLFRHFINNREQFLRYLLLLLSSGLHGSTSLTTASSGGKGSGQSTGGAPVFNITAEDLLTAWTHDSAVFRRLRDEIALIEETGRAADVIPDEFIRLWKEFEKVLADE